MNKITRKVDNINDNLSNIKDDILSLNITHKEYLLDYKLNDLISGVPIRLCKRCGKLFIPAYGSPFQKFCSDDCRYGTTKLTRKNRLKTDIRFKEIDKLRKAIYERKYRRPNNNYNLLAINEVLASLRELMKIRNNMNDEQFNNIIFMLKKKYKLALKP